MKIGILTSWRVPCGIYQYSARLAEALQRQPDTEVVILAGRADEHRSVPEESNLNVVDCSTIGLWRDDQCYSMDLAAISELDLDVIHVQYQSMLFTQPCLEVLAQWFNGVVAITYHDNCILGSFPHASFDLWFSHRWSVGPVINNGPTVEVIPFGIENRPPIVRTFGLGRTQSDIIAPICKRNGWIYEDRSSHEPIHGGGQQWQAHEDLIEWLKGADAIVLWYADHPQAGSSLAVRTAMATRRPVFVNDVTWFSDLPPVTRNFTKSQDEVELERHLRWALDNDYVDKNSWDNVVRLLVNRYESALVKV